MLLPCHYCNQGYTKEELEGHIWRCAARPLRDDSVPFSARSTLPPSRNSRRNGPQITIPQTPREYLQDGRSMCRLCGRGFSLDRVDRHEIACASSRAKRKPYDSSRKRCSDMPFGSFAVPNQHGLGRSKTSTASVFKQKSNWRQNHFEFQQAIRAAKSLGQYPSSIRGSNNYSSPQCSKGSAQLASWNSPSNSSRPSTVMPTLRRPVYSIDYSSPYSQHTMRTRNTSGPVSESSAFPAARQLHRIHSPLRPSTSHQPVRSSRFASSSVQDGSAYTTPPRYSSNIIRHIHDSLDVISETLGHMKTANRFSIDPHAVMDGTRTRWEEHSATTPYSNSSPVRHAISPISPSSEHPARTSPFLQYYNHQFPTSSGLPHDRAGDNVSTRSPAPRVSHSPATRQQMRVVTRFPHIRSYNNLRKY